MDNRLSVLVFSRDDASAVGELIEDVRKIADEVVIIDSSLPAQHRRLQGICSAYKGRARLFHAVALGYPDPLRAYGLHMCSNRWVLLIDTDERLSAALKDDIRDIIDADSADAFAIRRSEPIVDGERPRLYSWQIRLFKRDRVEFTGMVHEQARVNGRLGRLDSHMYTLQHMRGSGGTAPAEYSKMAMFERLSYSAYNEKIADYAFKLSIGTRGDDRSGPSNVARSAMLLYERLLSRDMDSEISDLDYFCYFWTRNIFYSLMRREYLGVLYAAANAHMELEAVREFRRADRGGEQFAISRIINKIGIIRFLGLDKDRNVEALNRRYRGSRQGIGLLQRLLLEQYGKVSRSSK